MELWHDYTFSFIFLSSERNDPGIITSFLLTSFFQPPPSFGHSPYIVARHRGRGGLPLLLSLRVFLTPLLVATLLSSPLYFALQNAGEEGESNLPLIAVQYSAYGARQGEKVEY